MTTETAVARAIVRKALSKGYMVSVWDGEEWALARCESERAIMAALQATDEEVLAIRNAEGRALGSILLVWGNSPEELVADYTDVPSISELIED